MTDEMIKSLFDSYEIENAKFMKGKKKHSRWDNFIRREDNLSRVDKLRENGTRSHSIIINNIVQFIKTLLLLMDDTELKIEEIEVNPLFVYDNQVKAIDAVIAVGN